MKSNGPRSDRMYMYVGLVCLIVIIALIASRGYLVELLQAQDGWKRTTASVFWVGEDANAENDFISNAPSAWDINWQQNYGGVDDPNCREGYYPCGFVPKENPFYIALPYNDVDDEHIRKETAVHIPWNDPSATGTLLKNRWVEVRFKGKSCYGQWEDVGPNGEDDWEYVFGDAKNPSNTFGLEAGIDLSPALRDCLGADGSSEVRWRHINEEEVPNGPWKEILTRYTGDEQH